MIGTRTQRLTKEGNSALPGNTRLHRLGVCPVRFLYSCFGLQKQHIHVRQDIVRAEQFRLGRLIVARRHQRADSGACFADIGFLLVELLLPGARQRTCDPLTPALQRQPRGTGLQREVLPEFTFGHPLPELVLGPAPDLGDEFLDQPGLRGQDENIHFPWMGG